MQYLIDTANLEEISAAFDVFPLAGVTTNPTILVKEKAPDYWEHLRAIREIIGMDKMLHIQVLGSTVEEMEKEARAIHNNIGGNLYIKIPVTATGLKAMRVLSQKGIKVTATAIYTEQQALLAAIAGAGYAAPYINRIDNMGGNGNSTAKEIADCYRRYELSCRVLGASFKNAQQVQQTARDGVQSVTVGYEVLCQVLKHPLTDSSVQQFNDDWHNLYGKITLL